jgi:hypothetical protein
MESKHKSEKPLRLFVNPFTIWTDLAFKTGQAMWASAHAAALRSTTARKVAVIPTADAPAPNAQEAAKPAAQMLASVQTEALRNAKVAVLPPADAPRKPRAALAQPSKVVRFKAARAKLRSKASTRRRPSAKGARARARR